MHRHATTVIAAMLVSSPVAQAAPACYARAYDDAHLAAHKGQTISVAKVWMTDRRMDDGHNINVELRFRLRSDPREFVAIGSCKRADSRITCSLDQDAGRLTMIVEDSGLKLSPVGDVRIDVATGEEDDYVVIQHSNPEDRTFALKLLDPADCREFTMDE